MKKYIKNGQIITEGTPISDDTYTYFNPTPEIYHSLGWEDYIEPEPIKTLEEVKQDKINEIINYDTSDNVNSFIVNGEQAWINKADRVGLMNSTSIEKANNKTDTYLWFNHTRLTISCDNLIAVLSALEEYALECYNVTEQHKANVEDLTTIEEVEQYDYTQSYPDKLTFII